MPNVGEHSAFWIRRMERVDWAHLEYSYEEAPNVPELIQTVAFGDDEQGCKACSTLHDNIVHQSSIYSSTCEAIPFLIEALAATATVPSLGSHVSRLNRSGHL
jgi:hypothetical protein